MCPPHIPNFIVGGGAAAAVAILAVYYNFIHNDITQRNLFKVYTTCTCIRRDAYTCNIN